MRTHFADRQNFRLIIEIFIFILKALFVCLNWRLFFLLLNHHHWLIFHSERLLKQINRIYVYSVSDSFGFFNHLFLSSFCSLKGMCFFLSEWKRLRNCGFIHFACGIFILHRCQFPRGSLQIIHFCSFHLFQRCGNYSQRFRQNGLLLHVARETVVFLLLNLDTLTDFLWLSINRFNFHILLV